jgi:hypothetical protein
MGILQQWTRSLLTQPAFAPLALVRIDDTYLAFLPFEMTMVAGLRLREEVQAQLGHEAPVVVVGLANGYTQYVTTAEEYQFQYYEGASNLYGPDTAEFLADQFGLLARAMDPSAAADPAIIALELGTAYPQEYDVGPQRERFPTAEDQPDAQEAAEIREPLGLCRLPSEGHRPPGFCFWWRDLAPGQTGLTTAPWIGVVEVGLPPPTASPPASDGSAIAGGASGSGAGSSTQVQASCEPTWYPDDRGLRFKTRAYRPSGAGWLWSTTFRPTVEQWNERVQRGLFHIRAGEVLSPPIDAAQLACQGSTPQPGCVPVCTAQQVRLRCLP